jgi:RNA polymerase sigma factor (TIGR02999 family)
MRDVYPQIRALAAHHLAAERPGHTLQATALVHEAFLKLMGPRDVPWQGRGHFYRAAADAVRQVLVDHARGRRCLKRGGDVARAELSDDAMLVHPETPHEDGIDHIALDDAFLRLSDRDSRLADVVRLRYYAGLSVAETALVLGVSERTVKSDWAFARAWLERELRRAPHAEP